MRRAARTDDNQRQIVEALRKAGRFVWIASSIGNGFPDVIVANPQNGKTYLLELKSKKGKLTDAQKKFRHDWPLENYHVARSIEAALEITA